MADDDRKARRAEADARFLAWVGELGDPGGTMLAAGYAYPERRRRGAMSDRLTDEVLHELAEHGAEDSTYVTALDAGLARTPGARQRCDRVATSRAAHVTVAELAGALLAARAEVERLRAEVLRTERDQARRRALEEAIAEAVEVRDMWRGLAEIAEGSGREELAATRRQHADVAEMVEARIRALLDAAPGSAAR